MDDRPEKIGVYPIVRELGRGGMGIVYLGRDTRLQRAVAIKVLPEAFARDPERLSRFEREARLLASLRHPRPARGARNVWQGCDTSGPGPGARAPAIRGSRVRIVPAS